MKRFSVIVFSFFISTTLISEVTLSDSLSKSVPPLTNILESELLQIENAGYHSLSDAISSPSNDDENWFFRRFLLRLRAKAGFSVGVAKVTVIPEFEFVFDRPIPAGWSTYKPPR